MKLVLLLCALLACAGPAAAQDRAPDPADANEVEAVVVIARRIGVPVWRVDRGDSGWR